MVWLWLMVGLDFLIAIYIWFRSWTLEETKVTIIFVGFGLEC